MTPNQGIVAITTKSGRVVEFDQAMMEWAWGGKYPKKTYAVLHNDSLFATVNKAPYKIALADVQHLWIRVEETDPYLTTVAVIGGVAVARR